MVRRRRRYKKQEELPRIDPEVGREISAVVFLALGGLLLLAVLGLGGVLGNMVNGWLATTFGWGRFAFAFILLFLGGALFWRRQVPVNYLTIFGSALVFLALISIFSLATNDLKDAAAGNFGGYFGYYFNFAVSQFLGFWASLLVYIAILAIGLLVTINYSIGNVFTFFGNLLPFNREPREERATRGVEEVKIHDSNLLSKRSIQEREPERAPVKEREPEIKEPIRAKSMPIHYAPLSLDLLEDQSSKPEAGNIKANVQIIRNTLATFGVAVSMEDVHIGPTVTQYSLRPATGVKLSQITGLVNDLSLALAAHPLRLEAPIPGKSLVGIEVPNKKFALVRLRNILESQTFANKKSPLCLAMGLDVAGAPTVAELPDMPHLLIAGSTGSGKSVCINAFILSLLYQNSPADLRLILVDPKRVELSSYADIPHLLTPVITEPDKVVRALAWLVAEMGRRYQTFTEVKARNLDSYNSQVSPEKQMPRIVLVIDELADLMTVSGKEVENYICRLAQMARATGIHLILATQRPSVDVITGLIKANIAARICFNVTSQIDSRTVIDMAGAEKLLGKGDMLYMSPDSSKPKRIQGVFISDREVKNVVNALKEVGAPIYQEEIISHNPSRSAAATGGIEDGGDELIEDAKDIILQYKKASASLLQRKLSVGYARAARILDLLEEQGVVGPASGSKPRQILIDDDSSGD